jgi:hypothetical protein
MYCTTHTYYYTYLLLHIPTTTHTYYYTYLLYSHPHLPRCCSPTKSHMIYICICICICIHLKTGSVYIYTSSRHHLTTAPSTSSRALTTNALNLLSYQPPQPHQPTIYIYIYIYRHSAGTPADNQVHFAAATPPQLRRAHGMFVCVYVCVCMKGTRARTHRHTHTQASMQASSAAHTHTHSTHTGEHAGIIGGNTQRARRGSPGARKGAQGSS